MNSEFSLIKIFDFDSIDKNWNILTINDLNFKIMHWQYQNHIIFSLRIKSEHM